MSSTKRILDGVNILFETILMWDYMSVLTSSIELTGNEFNRIKYSHPIRAVDYVCIEYKRLHLRILMKSDKSFLSFKQVASNIEAWEIIRRVLRIF